MVADVAAEDNLVTGAGPVRGDVYATLDHADTGGGDKYLIALAAIDHLGVAGHELNSGLSRGGTHRFHDPAQVVDRKALFQNEGCGEIQGPRPAHRKVVHGAVDCQPPDVASGKEDRRYDERVSRECQPCVAHLEHRLVVELVQHWIAECGQEDLVNQVGSKFAAAAVPEHDLPMIEGGQRARPEHASHG